MYHFQVQEHLPVFKQQNSEFVKQNFLLKIFCKPCQTKPINSDINKFLKPLVQTKTGIVNVRAVKVLRKMQVLKFKKQESMTVNCLKVKRQNI